MEYFNVEWLSEEIDRLLGVYGILGINDPESAQALGEAQENALARAVELAGILDTLLAMNKPRVIDFGTAEMKTGFRTRSKAEFEKRLEGKLKKQIVPKD